MLEKEILQSIGTKIKTHRNNMGLSQSELCRRCEIEKASLSRIEAGQTNITIRTLYRISKALKVNFTELI